MYTHLLCCSIPGMLKPLLAASKVEEGVITRFHYFLQSRNYHYALLLLVLIEVLTARGGQVLLVSALIHSPSVGSSCHSLSGGGYR